MISVIVPVYNVETYLERCITSIVKQSFKDLEILLIDDGSTDNSGLICDKWAEKDKRIHVIHKKNGGLSEARNTGLDIYKGEYVCFVDSDDYLEIDILEELMCALEKNKADIAVCNFIYEYEERMKHHYEEFRIEEELHLTGRQFMLWGIKERHSFGVVVWNKLFKRKIFQKLRFPKGKFHEDEFVFHEIMYNCKSVICIPKTGYHYFQREGSITFKGSHVIHTMEAFLVRCKFLFNQNDKELTILSEKNLVMPLKRIRKIKKQPEILNLKREYIHLIWKMYRKKWISMETFIKRMIRLIL